MGAEDVKSLFKAAKAQRGVGASLVRCAVALVPYWLQQKGSPRVCMFVNCLLARSRKNRSDSFEFKRQQKHSELPRSRRLNSQKLLRRSMSSLKRQQECHHRLPGHPRGLYLPLSTVPLPGAAVLISHKQPSYARQLHKRVPTVQLQLTTLRCLLSPLV